jgi:hypothetical protein
MFVIQRRPAIARVAGARLTVECCDLHAVRVQAAAERAGAPALLRAYADRMTPGWTSGPWRACTRVCE